jgi:hypothetical protein
MASSRHADAARLENTRRLVRTGSAQQLRHRVLKSFGDIVDRCCDAWNKLVDQPWKIMSIGLRDWAHEF